MRRAAGRCVLALALASSATAATAQRGGGLYGPLANPSAVLSAMLDLSQSARTAGQWEGMRKAAEKDAILFVPEAVNAQKWLQRQAASAAPMRWDVRQVFMSCDGGAGAVRGVWTGAGGTTGAFAAIWRAQKKGDFAWLVYDSGPIAGPMPDATDGIDGVIADCGGHGRAQGHGAVPGGGGKSKPDPLVPIADPPPANGSGQSRDGTLRWTWAVAPDRSRRFTVDMDRDGKDATVIDSRMAAP